MKRAILVLGSDKVIVQTAKKFKIEVVQDWELNVDLPAEKNLIVESGVRVPWDLLPAAWNFLTRWDAAVPLWLYGKLAKDVGSEDDRRRVAWEVRDMRILLHEPAMLFVKRSGDGVSLVKNFSAALKKIEDRRLAFLLALYRSKPKVCYLPTTWTRGTTIPGGSGQPVRGVVRRPSRSGRVEMVEVELEPGRVVKVRKGDEEKAIAMFEKTRTRRGG